MNRDEIMDKYHDLYEIALLYRRRLECPLTLQREYMEKMLKEVEEDIEKLHVLWDNLKN